MKKLILSVATVASVLTATAVPAFANVIHSNGSTGTPMMMGSNSGSTQGQAHRSSTGTQNKFTHDGWIMVD
ncbi:hypothetical protein [Alicyclobacillus mengziensis]|uniref:Uncharacterized protein n=1 Tax=Alicyclobacillus mengziensis TaxID=2931921 RepID=A0A9X7W1A0_9BACL|nr:hypothetical protein [Alicyclobacillus mengziensis]QSO48360.1 hypothetical protein JZ786_05060 [Alicyclobacillus mengziensis]